MKFFGESNCKEIKFPFWCILDSDGNDIVVSYNEGNKNIGYPDCKESIQRFVEIIRRTSHFSDVKLNLIAASF